MIDYTCDTVYNRSYWNDNSLGSLTYSDNALNQYTAVGGTTLNYDNRGNLTSGYGGGRTLGYDCENRLVSAIYYVSYGYDLLGRRSSRTSSSGTTVYVWDGAQIIAEYTNGALAKKYIYGPGLDNPVMMVQCAYGSQRYYYYPDALGSVRLITNASGHVMESYAYDPYGKPYVMNSPGPDGNWLSPDTTTTSESFYMLGNPYLFTGRRWDAATSLYYYRFRDYSPDLGRFLQADPAGYIDTMNLYAYCGNNPLNWVDPWGLDPKGDSGDLEGNPSAEFKSGKTPPQRWPDPGKGWKWNKEGYFEKGKERKHWHPQDPGHSPHWDINDQHGNRIRREFPPTNYPPTGNFLFIVPGWVSDFMGIPNWFPPYNPNPGC